MKRRTTIIAAVLAAALLFFLYAAYEIARFDNCLDRIDYDRTLWHRCEEDSNFRM